MATTSTHIGRPGDYRLGRRLTIGVVTVAVLAGLTILSVNIGGSTDLVQSTDPLTRIKAARLETVGGAAAVSPPRISYGEFKLSQVADMGFGASTAEVLSEAHSRFKLEQIRGDEAEVPFVPNLVE